MVAVSVIGAGYVGLVTAACLAELGHTVTCVEVDPFRLDLLVGDRSPIHEPDIQELLVRNRLSCRLRFTNDCRAAVAASTVVVVAVPTPSLPDGQADTRFVRAAVETILDHAPEELVVAIKSTVPVGTADTLQALAAERGRPGVYVASNPEFLREGLAVNDFLHPDRIVVGAATPEVHDSVAALYANLEAPIIRCSRRSAELGKYAANAFLAAKISFINEVAGISEATGADVLEVAGIMGSDPRIGPAFLQAGIGWGGSCFPKDMRALAAAAQAAGCSAAILGAVSDVNARQRERAFQALRRAVRGRLGATVAVLGLAFKPGTDDVRESPALDVIARLLEEGVHVRAHDPVAVNNAHRFLPQVQYCSDAYEAALGSDALFLAAEWQDYRALDWPRIAEAMRGRTVLDGRNSLDPTALASAGLDCVGFGRPSAQLRSLATHRNIPREIRMPKEAGRQYDSR